MLVIKKILKGVGFIKFLFCSIRPFSKILQLMWAKILHKTFKIQAKRLSFDLLLEKPMHLIVNDIEQFSYLFNIFYSEPFKITQTIQESPIIVDGGANIGMTSIYFHSRFPKATIYAFEPSPANIELLTHNLSNIQCSHIQQKALWDESKELIFNISECSRYNSAFNQEKTTRPVPVEAVRLSDWLETNRIRKIDVLKLNVEGAEIKAIRGLGNRIADVGLIIGEFHPQFVTNEELFEELHKIKFVLVKMVKTGKITSIFEAYNPNFYK